jgi:hypothetical protein
MKFRNKFERAKVAPERICCRLIASPRPKADHTHAHWQTQTGSGEERDIDQN